MQHRPDPENNIFINQVTDKCFDHLTDCKLDVEEFVNSFAAKVDEEDLEELKECIESFIALKDRELFHNAIVFAAGEDTLFFKYINNYYHLGVDSQDLDNEYASLEVYYDLCFMFSLPKDFAQLQIRQKESIHSIYEKIFKKNLDLNYSSDYIVICRSIIRGLFDIMTYEEQNKYPKDTIAKIVASKSIKDKILKGLLDFTIALYKYEAASPLIKSRMVSNGLAKSEDDLLVERNDSISANDTYVVCNKNTGEKYYVKNFSREVSWKDTLNPCEMYLYKVMEYMGYGPETHFLMDPEEDVLWSCGAFENNFILTRDVVKENGQKLFLDIESNEDYLRNFAGDGSDKVITKKFATEISAMVTLANLLPITDIFGKNGKNYGLVGNPDKADEYSLQFVDHWPSTNSVLSILALEEKNTYSPRASLSGMFFKGRDGCRILSPLAKLALESKDIHHITKSEIQDDVYRRIFCPQSGNINSLGLTKAMVVAKNDIENLFCCEKEERKNEAICHLDQYISKINDSTQNYFSSIGKNILRT